MSDNVTNRNTRHKKLKFHPGENNTMISCTQTKIDGSEGKFIVIANAFLGIKEGVCYDCLIRETKGRNGFLVVRAQETADKLSLVALGNCVGVYLERSALSGSNPSTNPLWIYDRSREYSRLTVGAILNFLQLKFNDNEFIVPLKEFEAFKQKFIDACHKVNEQLAPFDRS